MSRFTLDEDKAREWIAAAIENFKTGAASGKVELNPGYQPTQDFEGGETFTLVYEARNDEILAGPGDLDFDYQEDGNGAGYVWLLYVDGVPGHSLKLASRYRSLRDLGDGRDASGADGALGVLREARDAGNRLLDDLAEYVASVTAG